MGHRYSVSSSGRVRRWTRKDDGSVRIFLSVPEARVSAMSEAGRRGAREKLREAACNAVAGGSAGISAPLSRWLRDSCLLVWL